MAYLFECSLGAMVGTSSVFILLSLLSRYFDCKFFLNTYAWLAMISSYVLMFSAIGAMGQPPDYLSIWNWTMPIVAMASIPIAGYFTHYVVAEE